LAGVRVLDFCRVLSGPWSGQLLADLGAEVIKIEKPNGGDDFRSPPPHLKDSEGRSTRESALYLSCNRNKQSLTLDISNPAGQEVARRLAGKSDIVLENFRAGYMRRRGLHYEALAEINPGLIYCSISGFGQDGPYAQQAGYDSTFQAYSGMMNYTGHRDGEPGGGPLRTGPSLCDINAGMYATVGILAALHHRGATGRGQYIDIGMLDTTLAMVSHQAMAYLVAGEDAPRAGNGSAYGAPTGLFHAADGLLMINAAEDFNWVKLCPLLGFPEMATDPRFARRADRVRNQKALDDLMEGAVGKWKRAELLAALLNEGLPCAPVNDTAAAMQDPQVRHRNMLRELPHPLSATGSVRMVANPLRFSDTPLTRYDAPPLLGQHTGQVLASVLGLSAQDIDALREQGAL
jgi:crotonobetainyl-CoA:carnitine CoA-transferase CaiB-like acyl-CoA transferase